MDQSPAVVPTREQAVPSLHDAQSDLPRRLPSTFQRFAPWILALILSTIVPYNLLDLSKADLHAPLEYSSSRSNDSIGIVALVKNVHESGWYLTNSHLGAPGVQKFTDYPQSNSLHLIAMKVFSWITGDAVTAFNYYFLLSYPLITLASMYVLMRLGIWWPAALTAGLLYACLPYRFLRSTHHFFLSVYYIVPLVSWVALWLTEAPGAFRLYSNTLEGRVRWNPRALTIAGALMVVTASSDIYYAVFTGFFIALAGAMGWARSGDSKRALIAVGLIALLVITLGVQLSPSIFSKDGPNPEAVIRHPAGAEVLGFKIAQLLLPVSHHRIPSLAKLREFYTSYGVATNENDHVALGMVASIGFLFLLGTLFFHGRRSSDLLFDLSRFNVGAVLLGTIGGFGALSGLLLTPNIRGFNRIAVYIGFFSLAALAYAVDRLHARFPGRTAPQVILCCGLGVIGTLGLLDQCAPVWTPEHEATAQKFRNDRDFVKRVESQVEGSDPMVFQLPYIPFPEFPGVQRMNGTEPLRAYIHSTRIHWSFGAMRGRLPDLWQRTVTEMPASQMVAVLAVRGFTGIYLDRFGYADNGAAMEAELTGILGAPTVVSADNRKVYYDLRKYRQDITSLMGPEQARAAVSSVDPVISISWGKGAHAREADGTNVWHWCEKSAELQISNASESTRQLELATRIDTGNKDLAHIYFEGGLLTDAIPVQGSTSYRHHLTVPPGRHVLKIRTDAKRLVSPTDPRELYFRLVDLKVYDGEAPQLAADWKGRFSYLEKQDHTWRWCGRTGDVELVNRGKLPVLTSVSMLLQTPFDAVSNLHISGPGLDRTVRVNLRLTPFHAVLSIPPGIHTIHFESDGREQRVAGDPRELVFRVLDPAITPVSMPAAN